MKGAARLSRIQLGLGFVAALLVIGAAALVAVGTSLASLPGAAVASACTHWLGSGGPAALIGLALLAGAVAVAVRAAHSTYRQLHAGRAYLRALEIGAEGEIGGVSYRRIESTEPLAFCAGYLRPHIYLSAGSLGRLDHHELRAVVAHEAHRLLGRALSDGLFFVPVLRRMCDRYATLGELAADEAAVNELGDRRPLASALLKFSDAESVPTPVAGVDPERVDHLLGSPSAGAWGLRRASLLGNLAVVAGLGVVTMLIASGGIDPNLTPAFALATACMVGMYLGPVAILGATVVASRRVLVQQRS